MKTLTLREGLIQTQIGSDLLIYDVMNENFYAFNETASRIMNALQYCLPYKKFISVIYDYFSDTDNDKIRKKINSEVETFLKTLKNENIVQETLPSQINPLACSNSNIQFKTPHFNKYSKQWLKKNHPAAFYSIGFGDTWGPGGDRPHPLKKSKL